jgi:aspartyl-tRNA(Asn)/glutamyl-tRNA(Gln) amidotransferase subunit B
LLIIRIQNGTISNNGAKQLLDLMWKEAAQLDSNGLAHYRLKAETGHYSKQIDDLIEASGLKQMSDTGELEAIIDTVLASNAKSVEEYKAGNVKAFNALVGQAMKATKGKGNPAQVNELLKKKLV